ncbi:MIP/aquaporin family protein [soil metagenome]|jgi:arsenate reductase
MTARRLAAEFIGTALLLLAIVGSGIAASTDGPASAQLFQHATIVGAALATLIVTFGSVSGAHFNPAVSVVDSLFGGLTRRLAAGYVVAQVGGAATGVVLANALFGLPAVAIATTHRSGTALIASEVVATYGLLLVIFGVVRSGRAAAVPAAVGSWIAAAIYFTSSASFANPAVTIARLLTDTYTGIAPPAVPGFIGAQVVGAAAAWLTIRWLFAPGPELADDIVVPRHDRAETGASR